ncbi:MAG: undecaprenyl-diphosphate phosphatase, partial [Christensenellales bacterium]
DYKTAVWIGVFQILALIPGTSRSGTTILGAVLLGCARPVAAEFSFFLAIPVMLGASGLKLIKYASLLTGEYLMMLLIGTVVAFVVSLFAIRFLMRFIQKHTFKPFGVYRIVLGLLILLYFGFLAV